MACTRSSKSGNTADSAVPSPRRSQRTRKTRATTSPGSQVIRRSARLANRSLSYIQQTDTIRKQSYSSFIHKDNHDITTTIAPTAKIQTSTSRSYPEVFSHVDETASESASPLPFSTTEHNSDTVPDPEDETKSLSVSNLSLGASHAIYDRKENHDNWWRAENEEYEFDGFVVGDEEVDEDEGRNGKRDWSDRKNSFSSTSSEDTLFVPEIKAKKRKHADEREPEDVAEQISDAIVLFSRRCNRDLEPVVLRATKRIRRNTEVAAVWDRAVRLGFGWGTEMSNGSIVWCVGPRVVNGVP